MGGAIQLVTAEVTEPPDGGATDDDLVSLATQGNRAAFEALLRRHYDLMHRVAWRMTGSQTDAQDICQDVCCALVERIASSGVRRSSQPGWSGSCATPASTTIGAIRR